ncbi:MAG: virulence factor [Candidatus Rokubacteria bacterium]|nr:virulence factor [Candidatus Rokubacteria bacterium]
MARYQILYWKEIPSLVEATDGRETVQVPLSERFQELIDAVAMLEGIFGAEEYLEQWHKGPVHSRDGVPEDVAERIAAELEAAFNDLRARHLHRLD